MTKHYVFLVEDDDGLREMMAAVLTANGYVVVTASNGLNALVKLAAIRAVPDAILTDFEMPLMTGDVLIQKLRQHSKFAKVPIAVISGLPRAAPGADCVLRKPLFPDALVRAVKLLCAGALTPPQETAPSAR